MMITGKSRFGPKTGMTREVPLSNPFVKTTAIANIIKLSRLENKMENVIQIRKEDQASLNAYLDYALNTGDDAKPFSEKVGIGY